MFCVATQGLRVVQAPGEAEAVCAALDRAGHVDACVTKDSDALLFGAQTLFQTIKPVVSILAFLQCHEGALILLPAQQ